MSDSLPNRCEVKLDFDRYEYKTTEGQRKCWDGDPDLTKEGWEEWAEWERFEYTEERYWRRPLNEKRLAEAQRAKVDRDRTTARLVAERAVIEAARNPRLRLQFKRPSGVPGPFPEVEAAFWEALKALEEK